MRKAVERRAAIIAAPRRISPRMLTRIYMVVFLGGIVLSAAITPDRIWWKAFFSVLGGGEVLSAHVFNMTLILSGVLLGLVGTLLQREVGAKNRFVGVIEVGFWLMGLGLMIAGLVPYDKIYTVHYLAANLTALGFAMLALRLHVIHPHISRQFIYFNYGILAGVAIMYAILYGTKLINMTTMEIIIGILFFIWLERFVIEIMDLKNREKTAATAC